MPELASLPRAPLKRFAFRLASGALNGLCRLPGHPERPLARLAAKRIIGDMAPLGDVAGGEAIRVLGFSTSRSRQDFLMLANSPDIDVFEAPNGVVQAINSLFATRPLLPPRTPYHYWQERDQGILAARERLGRFLREVLAQMKEIGRIDCIVTPAAHYEYQIPWAASADAIGLPFVAIHKEFTVLGERHFHVRLETLKARNLRFPGTAVLVANQRAKRLFAAAGVAPSERIVVTGLPRMDRLFAAEGPFRTKAARTRKQVALFSFGHYAGGLGSAGPSRSKLFSANDDHGFVRLFDQVHGTIGRLAIAHPEVDFKIKPKSVEDWWVSEIERAVEAATGRPMVDISNCEAVDGDAAALIRDSDAVIGFGSTVLLEARILGVPTVIPVFAEAVDTYPDNVYLADELDIFRVATSPEDLVDAIEEIVSGTFRDETSRARRSEVFCDYLGFDDDGSTERVRGAIVAIAKKAGRAGNANATEAGV